MASQRPDLPEGGEVTPEQLADSYAAWERDNVARKQRITRCWEELRQSLPADAPEWVAAAVRAAIRDASEGLSIGDLAAAMAGHGFDAYRDLLDGRAAPVPGQRTGVQR